MNCKQDTLKRRDLMLYVLRMVDLLEFYLYWSSISTICDIQLILQF